MRQILIVISILGAFVGPISFADMGSPGFRVVVHPSNPEIELDQTFLARVYLKKTTYWADNRGIVPVDLRIDSPVRQGFSEFILEKPISAVRNYWRQKIFSGKGIPPLELKTDGEVVEYVSAHPDAIGYVSSRADIRNLKSVRIR